MVASNDHSDMTCDQAQLLIGLYFIKDPIVTEGQGELLEAYLWTKTYPEEAEELLSGDKYLSGYLLLRSLSGGIGDVQSWLRQLDEEVQAAQIAGFTAQELLTTPQSLWCESQARTLGQELSAYVEAMARED